MSDLIEENFESVKAITKFVQQKKTANVLNNSLIILNVRNSRYI